MIYKFTYFYNDNLFSETYTDDVKATAKFLWLTSKNIAFKIITISKRHNKYIS